MADFTDELFSYASGALDEPGCARVEAMLAADPALRARLAWYEAVCDAVIGALPEPRALPSADAILARLGGGDRGKERGGFFAWLAGPGLRPAAAFATAVIVIQGVVIGMLAREPQEGPAVRAVAPAGKAVIFVVAFDPDATEAKIRGLLLKAGATIVDGPKQLGDYRVSVPANRAQYAKELFEQSGIAEYVRVQEPR